MFNQMRQWLKISSKYILKHSFLTNQWPTLAQNSCEDPYSILAQKYTTFWLHDQDVPVMVKTL